jgi:hypothetical protein
MSLTAARCSTISNLARGIAHGYRSGLEEKISKQIEAAGIPVSYEEDKIRYTWPSRESSYTPDFRIPGKNGTFIYIETKGRWLVDDRQKHLLIREQRPDLDIRFVFSNQNARLYKSSPTTYAMWCDKFGFKYANRTIPEEWLNEWKEKHDTD